MTGQQLKKRLEETNLSMRYISDKIGISPQSLNQIFKADDIKTGMLEKLCAALDLPMSYFFGGSPVLVHDNEQSFNNTNDSKTLEDLTRIINEQRKRIDYLTDQLLKK